VVPMPRFGTQETMNYGKDLSTFLDFRLLKSSHCVTMMPTMHGKKLI